MSVLDNSIFDEKWNNILSSKEKRLLAEHKLPFHYSNNLFDDNCYSMDTVKQIQILYIIAAIIWIVLVFYLSLTYNILTYTFIIIPLIVFGINYFYASKNNNEVESEMFKGNFLSFVFLIIAIIISWTKTETDHKYYKIALVSIILIVLSLYDVWLPKDKLPLAKHFRTIAQTASISVLIIAIVSYYDEILSKE